MDESTTFLYKIRRIVALLFSRDPSYKITRSFALKMLPLSFAAGLFICFAIPASYCVVARQESLKQAELHANYVASIFRETMEMYPLDWKERIQSRLTFTDICYVRFYDSRGNLIASINNFKPPHRLLLAKVRKTIFYAGAVYGYVEVGISLQKVFSYILRLLLFSLVCGTLEGIALFLLPVFEIQAVEEEVNRSQRLLLQEQAKLRRSEAKYRTLFELAPDGNVVTTENGQIISCNPAFRQMLQLGREDIHHLNIKDFYANPEEREEILNELFKTGEIRNREVLFRRRDGTELPVLISMRLIGASVMEDELPPEYWSFVVIFNIIRDVSRIKEMERQLLQAQKLESIGLLAGGIAHDFNNILAAILGYTELLKGRLREEKLTRYVTAIEKSAIRAAGLVKNLLAFARAGKYQVGEVNLNDIVEEVISLLEHSIEKKIHIVKDLDPDLPPVLADPSQINQVLLNLCVNARDALMTQGGGRIFLRTFKTRLERQRFLTGDVSKPGEYVGMAVQDNGPGIPAKILEKIFDPFFTTKKPGEGSGLGLSVVYGIVRNHGGYIDVVSEPGKTEFVVYLPIPAQEELAKRRPPREPEVVSPSEALGQGTILLIDDEEEVRQMGKMLLEERGYRVLLAANGEEGLRIFQEQKDEIDLVLLDLIMPGKDGIEVFHALRQLDPGVKIVLVTGYVVDKEARKLLQEGASGFLSKPYQIKDLLLVIQQALKRA